MINKCGLFAISLLISVGISCVVFSDVSKAATVYDDIIKQTDTIEIGGTNFYGTCPIQDITYNYMDYVHQDYINLTTGTPKQAYDQYLANLNVGKGWLVTTSSPTNGIASLVVFDPNADIEFFTYPSTGKKYLGIKNSSYLYSFHINGAYNPNVSSADACKPLVTASNSISTLGTGIFTVSGVTYIALAQKPDVSINPTRHFLFINGDITYPSGYVGIVIPDIVNAPTNTVGVGFTPSFKYNVDDLDFTIQDITLDNMVSEFNITDCYFQIPNNQEGDSFSEYEYDCATKPEVTHTFTGYASYNIIQRMYSRDDDKWYDTTRVITVDGSTFAGTVNDPTTTNAVTRLLGSLDNIETFGLQQFFLAPINFYATLPALAENCSPISIPLMGQNISLQCMKPLYYNWSTSIMTIYTTVLTAGIAYLVASNIFRTIKNINSPDKDGIEVAKL
jgi:hypothetical protein